MFIGVVMRLIGCFVIAGFAAVLSAAVDVGEYWIPPNTPLVTGVIAAIWTEEANGNTIP